MSYIAFCPLRFCTPAYLQNGDLFPRLYACPTTNPGSRAALFHSFKSCFHAHRALLSAPEHPLRTCRAQCSHPAGVGDQAGFSRDAAVALLRLLEGDSARRVRRRDVVLEVDHAAEQQGEDCKFLFHSGEL